jgi:heterodisulfide reductase subunit A
MLMKGVAELDPLVATVDTTCTWCGKCQEACPYAAIEKLMVDGRETAVISATSCKGCGGCVPYCPVGAIDLLGSTNAQILAMIDCMAGEPPVRVKEPVS